MKLSFNWLPVICNSVSENRLSVLLWQKKSELQMVRLEVIFLNIIHRWDLRSSGMLRSHRISSLTSWLWKMGMIGCPETSVQNYHSTLRNIPEERKSYLHLGGSPKSRIIHRIFECVGHCLYTRCTISFYAIAVDSVTHVSCQSVYPLTHPLIVHGTQKWH
jgi:hypothetical protein